MGEIDYWDLFYIGNTTYFLFPRFRNKDYSIKLKDFYYHNTTSEYYYLEKENNTNYIIFNISPVYKKFKDNNKFMPCIYIQPKIGRNKNNEGDNIISIVKSCSSYDELMEQFIDNFYNFGEIIALYPIKYIEGIRIERSIIIDDIISNTINFIDMFSNKLICERKFNTNGWLNSHKYNISIESCNLGWLNIYKKDLISSYKANYLLCDRDPRKKDLYFMHIK